VRSSPPMNPLVQQLGWCERPTILARHLLLIHQLLARALRVHRIDAEAAEEKEGGIDTHRAVASLHGLRRAEHGRLAVAPAELLADVVRAAATQHNRDRTLRGSEWDRGSAQSCHAQSAQVQAGHKWRQGARRRAGAHQRQDTEEGHAGAEIRAACAHVHGGWSRSATGGWNSSTACAGGLARAHWVQV